MRRQIVYRSIVFDDLSDLADYIARDNIDAAIRFLDAAEETFASLAKSPTLGNACEFEHPALSGIRQWHVRGFRRYLIFYRVSDSEIEIVRVLHAARDWINLLRNRP